MILKLSLDLPEDQAYIKMTRLLGRTLLQHLKAVEQDIDEIEVVVGELCANVVRHSRSSEGRFSVVLEYHADRVVVTVEDRGQGFSFKDVPAIGAERPDHLIGGKRVGGFGLQLVDALSDHLEFRRGDPVGTTVRAEKHVAYRSPAAAAAADRMDSKGKGVIACVT